MAQASSNWGFTWASVEMLLLVVVAVCGADEQWLFSNNTKTTRSGFVEPLSPLIALSSMSMILLLPKSLISSRLGVWERQIKYLLECDSSVLYVCYMKKRNHREGLCCSRSPVALIVRSNLLLISFKRLIIQIRYYCLLWFKIRTNLKVLLFN